MQIFTDILKLCAGIGLFLFAMYLLEKSLKNISKRNFKLFLRRITKNRLGAVTGGALVTVVLFSSSVVSLIVLAFVGAGLFTMKNALAVILGANLGTTISNWLVATVGFKANVEILAYPLVFVGGLLLIIFGKRKSIQYLCYFLLGFGLLFISLSFMTSAMESQVQKFDFTPYTNMPPIGFLGLGFLITLLIQSSSVTMALSLTALHVGVINFPSAAAIVLGSETGTTVKLVLTGLGGTIAKKRVVLGNLIFNLFLTIVSFLFLRQILALITDVLNIQDPLIGLVSFSTAINFLGLLIFLPLLTPYVKFLEIFFKNSDASASAFIGRANTNEAEKSLELFRKEIEYFIYNAMLLNLEQFKMDTNWLHKHADFTQINQRKKIPSKTPDEKYEFIKLLQGELQGFYLSLRKQLKEEQKEALDKLVSSARSCMFSVKSIKDVRSNITNLAYSSKDVKFGLFQNMKKQTETLYRSLDSLISNPDHLSFQKLRNIFVEVQNNYTSTLSDFYVQAQDNALDGIDLTTSLSLNRELFTSDKALIMAVKDLLLDGKERQDFNAVVEYKT